MPEEEVEHREGTPGPEKNESDSKDTVPAPRRGLFSLRNFALFLGVLGIGAALLFIVLFVSYRAGVFDSYIKAQLVSKFSAMGMAFDADVFRITANPLQVELKNATFKDKLTGEP